MIQKRWGGKEPMFATRVEYQCNREWLDSVGVEDFKSLLRLTPSILQYLTGAGTDRWFRFLQAKSDGKHPERDKTLRRWQTVQNAFLSEFQWGEPLREIDPDNADVEMLLKQAFGVLECAAANRGFDLPWKETTAPAKYRFGNYADFERWMVVMLRSVAVQKPEWRESAKDLDALDFEEMLARKNTISMAYSKPDFDPDALIHALDEVEENYNRRDRR
jgi:hypothetical protein